MKQKINKTTNINNNNNNTINNNTTNNIVINNFGNENLECLTPEYLTELFRTPFLVIPRLIKAIHFNDKYPENKNVRILCQKNRFIEVHCVKWMHRNKKYIIKHMVETGHDIIETNMDNELEGIKNSLTKYLKQYNTDNKIKDRVNENAELAILNNSK